jgi:hypothetical protein
MPPTALFTCNTKVLTVSGRSASMRVSVFGLRVSVFGFRLSASRNQVPVFGSGVQGLIDRVSDAGNVTKGVEV